MPGGWKSSSSWNASGRLTTSRRRTARRVRPPFLVLLVVVLAAAAYFTYSEMLRHYLSADVLYVGHHGSRTSTTQAFLDAVAPSFAVISVGRNNSYGHPHDEVIDRLEEAGIIIYRTDQHGHIVMVTDGSGITVSIGGAN